MFTEFSNSAALPSRFCKEIKMATNNTSVHSFRLVEAERLAIQLACGKLSIGEFARRAALDITKAPQISEKIAIGKTIHAIHLAIGSALPRDAERKIRRLLAEALEALNEQKHGEDSGQAPENPAEQA